jgi:hypothetical protein
VDEDKKRAWDVALGIVTPIVTIVGLLIGVWQFNAGEANKVKLEYDSAEHKDRIEFRRRLWTERLSTYRAVAELAGRIVAASDDRKSFDTLARQFTALYWGTSVIAEDKPVEQAMIDFNLALHDFRAGTLDANGLKKSAFVLLKACQASERRRDPEL